MEQEKIGTDVALLLDEVYLQIDSQYQDGKLVDAENEGNLYKGVVTFMINSLKKYIPFVIKVIPEIKSEGKWLLEHIDNCITSFNSVGFNIFAIILHNHSINVLVFKYLFNIYGNEQKMKTLLITHPVQAVISICFLIQCTYSKTFVTIYLTHRDLFFHLLNLISFSILLMCQGEK